jgi:hypothetical protein
MSEADDEADEEFEGVDGQAEEMDVDVLASMPVDVVTTPKKHVDKDLLSFK